MTANGEQMPLGQKVRLSILPFVHSAGTCQLINMLILSCFLLVAPPGPARCRERKETQVSAIKMLSGLILCYNTLLIL